MELSLGTNWGNDDPACQRQLLDFWSGVTSVMCVPSTAAEIAADARSRAAHIAARALATQKNVKLEPSGNTQQSIVIYSDHLEEFRNRADSSLLT